MTPLMVILTLLGQPSTDDWSILVTKLEETDAGDPRALLELGQLCEEKKCPGLARNAYRKIRPPEDGPGDMELWCEARYRIARIEIAGGNHQSAFQELREILLQCPDHEAARSLLLSAESSRTREQVRHVERGAEHLEAGNLTKALEAFERAFELTPEAPGQAAYVPRRVILERLAECRSRIQDARYEREFLRVNRTFAPCPVCSPADGKGFLECQRCGGTGRTELSALGPVRGGLKREVPTETCLQCGGRGYVACGHCFALGYSSPEITSRERKALVALAQGVTDPKLYRQPLDRALKIVEDAILSVKEGATWNYLRAMKPEYSLSGKLRKALEAVPAASGSLERAIKEWQKKDLEDRSRVNFLLNYACEFASYLRHFEMLRASAPLDLSRLQAGEPSGDRILSPEILCAFPDTVPSECVTVRGILTGTPPGESGEHKRYLTLESGIPHGVRFFAWLPTARKHVEWLETRAWKKPLDGLAHSYPFDIGGRLEEAPRNHQVIVTGRLLRNPMGYPRDWFEVWDVKVGPSRLQEELFVELSKPLDINFPGNSLDQVGRILGQWFDLEVRFEDVDSDALVICEARACPRGLLLDEIAKSALACDWYYEEGRVVFCASGANPMNRDMAAVLGRLGRSPDTHLVVRRVDTDPTRHWDLPDDPAGLRVAAEEFRLRMEYRAAGLCYEALLAATRDPERRGLLGRLRDKMALFRELTWLTPVSRLVESRELSIIVYQKPSGDLVQATVILWREGESFVVQEAYGASFRIEPDLLRKVTPLPGGQWLESRLEELRTKEAELEAADPEERASKLFLLALFSKTHGFTEKGTRFLERAVALDGFEALLGRFFPERGPELSALWRRAMGRERAPSEVSMTPELKPPPETAGLPPESLEETTEDGLTDQELLALVRTHAGQGKASAHRILRGEDAAEWRQRALENFSAAERALEILLERRPEDPVGIRLRDDIAALKSACVEDLGFFEEPSRMSDGGRP